MDYQYWVGLLWAAVQWLFDKGLAAFDVAWTTSKKATEIAIVGFVIFCVVVWLGFAHAPKVPADTASLDEKLAKLSDKIDALDTDVKVLKAPPVAATSPTPAGPVTAKKIVKIK